MAEGIDIHDDELSKEASGLTGKAARQIAVALSYRPTSVDDAPKVVASGRGKTAQQIPVEGLKVPNIEDNAMPLGNRPVIDCFWPDYFE